MTDVFSKKKRAQIMSKIKGKNTKLEETGYSILRECDLNFRKHPKGIYGNPDAANKRLGIAVFFDSDFWHGYNYYKGFHKKLPNDYWHKKIQTNIARDIKVNMALRKSGWKVLRFWEHDLIKNKNKCIIAIQKILEATKGN